MILYLMKTIPSHRLIDFLKNRTIIQKKIGEK